MHAIAVIVCDPANGIESIEMNIPLLTAKHLAGQVRPSRRKSWHWISAACIALTSVGAVHAQGAAPDSAQWFALGSVHALAGSSSPVTLNMGGPVVLVGQQELGTAPGVSLSIGKQWTRYEDGAATKSWRIDAQALSASFTRNAASVSTLLVPPGDKVQANMLFLNGSWQLAKSEAEDGLGAAPLWRAWLGVGLGVANVSVPKPAALVGGCSCFSAASGSGLAYQLRLSVERKIAADNWFLQAQLAHLGMPAVSTAAGSFPQTRYGAIGTSMLSFGVLKVF